MRERPYDERLVSFIRLRYNERGRQLQRDREENSSGLIVHSASPFEKIGAAPRRYPNIRERNNDEALGSF